MRRSAIVFALALLPAPTWAQPFHTAHTTCSYSDKARHISLSNKPCVLQETRINGHFAWAIKFPSGPTVTVEYLDSGSLDYGDEGYIHIWNINGQPAKGYEPDRNHLHGETNDKNQTVAWFEPD